MTARRWLFVLFAALLTACSSQPKKLSSTGETAAEINARLGLGYMQEGNYDVALDKLNRALKENPRLPAAHHYIAELYKRLKNYDLAEEHYRRAIDLAPDDAAVQNNYGVFLCDRQRYAEAETHFLKAARMKNYQSPDEAYNNAALCALRIPDKDKARKYFRAALEANALLASALIQMSALSVEENDYPKARAFLQRYEAIGPKTAQSLYLGAMIEQHLNNATAAAEYARELREQFPTADETARLQEMK
jgi:type IV pilus assembly protein PilF